MPQWLHSRAEHLLAKDPSMSKGTAFAIATQQSHAVGKTPKGYGTSEGKREAKVKYDAPKREYERKANPGNLETPRLSSGPKTRWTGERSVKKEASMDREREEQAARMKAAYAYIKMGTALRTPESQLAKTQNVGVPKGEPKPIQFGKLLTPKDLGMQSTV